MILSKPPLTTMRASPGAILGPARKALPYALLTFLVVLVLQWRHFDSAQYTSKFNTFKHNVLGGDAKCPLDAEYLLGEQYGLKGDVVFHKQCVRATDKKPINRDEVANVSQSLFAHRQDLNLDSDCYSWDAMPCEPIDVAVPSPYPIRKYPEFIFGLATSFDRLVDSVPQLSHWLRDSGVRLVAMLTDAHEREQELDRLTAFYEENGVELVKAADFCGDCLLQRWRFGDDTVLVNGYSASEYSDGLGAIPFRLISEPCRITWPPSSSSASWRTVALALS
jgi:hypothetical protein